MKIVSFVVCWILSLVGMFYFGAYTGVREFWFSDSQYQAAVTAAHLKLIEVEKIDDLKQILEIKLNENIAGHADYLDSKYKWLWSSEYDGKTRAIQYAVDYRILHPFEEPDLSNPKNWKSDIDLDDSFMRDVIDGQIEQQKKLKIVIDKYTIDK